MEQEGQMKRAKHTAIFEAVMEINLAIQVLRNFHEELCGETSEQAKNAEEPPKQPPPSPAQVYSNTPDMLYKHADEIRTLVGQIKDIVL